MTEDFESVDIESIPLEQMRAVMAALMRRLDLRLEYREHFHGEPEFRFIGTR